MNKAVFLDRDGVVNASVVRAGKPYPPANAEEMVLLPGVVEAVAKLRAAGYLCIVATNQPDIGRGTTPLATVQTIHDAIQSRAPMDAFYMCPHGGSEGCHCRKPEPGMLLDAAKAHQIDLHTSFMVGDRWRDIEAGQRAGVRTLFVDYGYDEKQPVGYDWRVNSLAEAADIILSLSQN